MPDERLRCTNIVACMESFATVAFGVQPHLVETADGGRTTALLGGNDPAPRFKYRPNWGLPGKMPPDQTGAPVLGFSREYIAR